MQTANLRQNLKKTAKVFADEPLEILKAAKRQVAGVENSTSPDRQDYQEQRQDEEEKKKEESYKKQIAESEGRTLQALENELKDIRRQKLFKDLMDRVQSGENVPLEEFSELSYEQKDVLKAQMEAVKNQKIQSAKNQNNQLIEPTAKKGRQMFGQKKSAQKQTTRVEKPVPPSG